MKAYWRLMVVCAAMSIVMGGVSGCSSLPFFAHKAPAAEPMTRDIGRGLQPLTFTFESDGKGEGAEEQVGSGYIVVSREGKEIQALPHAFEMPHDRFDPKAWLHFSDFNGDGLLDFKVVRLYTQEGQLPLESLYQFDASTGNFAQVEALSNAGALNPAAPGCVTLKVLNAAGALREEQHCYLLATSRWVRGKTSAGGKAASGAEKAEAICDAQAPELVACRRTRIEQDRRLLTLVREFRSVQKQALKAAQGRGYADAYGRMQDLEHQSWLRHRDARCAAQVREQGTPIQSLAAATELCRYDWARDQWQRYRAQMARLPDAAGKSQP